MALAAVVVVVSGCGGGQPSVSDHGVTASGAERFGVSAFENGDYAVDHVVFERTLPDGQRVVCIEAQTSNDAIALWCTPRREGSR